MGNWGYNCYDLQGLQPHLELVGAHLVGHVRMTMTGYDVRDDVQVAGFAIHPVTAISLDGCSTNLL